MHAAVRYMSLAAAALVAASVSVAAQSLRSSTTGLVLDLHLNGSSIKAEDASNESGAGIGGRIGYGFSPRLTAYVGYDRASIESADVTFAEEYTLGQLDLGLQYNFANNDRAWRPFLEAAATRRAVNVQDVDLGAGPMDMSMYGYGMTLGGGFQYFLSAPWAISTGLNYTFGSFSKGKVEGGEAEDIDPAISARGARFNIGISWHPMAGR